MSTLVICLVVVGAAFAVVNRSYDPSQTATNGDHPRRGPVNEVDEPHGSSTRLQGDDPVALRRGPRHLAGRTLSRAAGSTVRERSVVREPTVGATVSAGQRLRSGVLLLLLVVAMGTSAALMVGFLVVALVTILRSAIG